MKSELRCPVSLKYTLDFEEKRKEYGIFLYGIHDEVIIWGYELISLFYTFCCTLKKMKLETTNDELCRQGQ